MKERLVEILEVLATYNVGQTPLTYKTKGGATKKLYGDSSLEPRLIRINSEGRRPKTNLDTLIHEAIHAYNFVKTGDGGKESDVREETHDIMEWLYGQKEEK